MDQVKTIYKISQILLKAFKEVNDVCAHSLADRSMQQENANDHAEIAHNSKHEKPKKEQPLKGQSQPKKQTKKQVKVTSSETPEPQKQKSKPVKQESKQKADKKQKQPQSNNKEKHVAHPDKPKQPLSAFFIFQQQQKDNVKKINPDAGVTDISKMMGQIWRGLSQDQRAPYHGKGQKLKAKYEKQLKKFYDKHPEQKSKKQLKRQKAQNKKKQESESSSPIQAKNPVPTKASKKAVAIQQQESESV